MSLLARFWQILAGRSAESPPEASGLAWPPESDEPLCRYLLSKSHFSRANGSVKASAFLPGPDGRKSVFRTLGLGETAIWELGEREVVKPPHRMHGRADIKVEAVLEAGIAVHADRPPSRHADLAHWPTDESARLLAATELATASELRLNPAVYG